MKGIINLLFMVIAVLAIAVIALPGLGQSIISSLTGVHPSCYIAPYDKGCVCGSGEEKIDVTMTFGIQGIKWNCENVAQRILNPESPTFQSDAISYVKTYLADNCGSVCTDLECGEMCANPQAVQWTTPDKPECIEADFGYGTAGERIVDVHCHRVVQWSGDTPTSSVIDWWMKFYVVSPTGTPEIEYIWRYDNYCRSPGGKFCVSELPCNEWKARLGPTYDNCVGTLPLVVRPK